MITYDNNRYNTAIAKFEHRSEYELTKYTPYLMYELWCVLLETIDCVIKLLNCMFLKVFASKQASMIICKILQAHF